MAQDRRVVQGRFNTTSKTPSKEIRSILSQVAPQKPSRRSCPCCRRCRVVALAAVTVLAALALVVALAARPTILAASTAGASLIPQPDRPHRWRRQVPA